MTARMHRTDLPDDNGLPTAVNAALGLVATAVDNARRLPITAVTMPIRTVGLALVVGERARREYVELADRGREVVARMRGQAADTLDELGDEFADGVDFVGDAAEEAADEAVDRATDAADAGLAAVGEMTDRLAGVAQDAYDDTHDALAAVRSLEEPEVERLDAELAAELTESAHDTAADAEIGQPSVGRPMPEPAGGPVSADDLPLADFDHLTLGQVRGRMRTLDQTQLLTLLNYERGHANRASIVTMLSNRIAKLHREA